MTLWKSKHVLADKLKIATWVQFPFYSWQSARKTFIAILEGIIQTI